MSTKLETLRADVAELYRLSELTDRKRIKDVLSIEAKKLETEISQLQSFDAEIKSKPTSSGPVKRCFDVRLTSYGWDQTDSTVKIFITLPKVETLPPENIICKFTTSAFDLTVKELENKNYVLSIKNLYSPISTEKCSWKVKAGMITLSLAKNSNSTWPDLTKTDKQSKKTPQLDDDADPAAGLMSLMRQMYEDGDDEMKRTIAKAWAEGREKNSNMNMNF
ncbi:hypothetical protein V9T40_001138 [Parthenolecanium corni]|uniref:Calcyclin-binding protein n=1 Tax=Parthenolecanium corni TaxID=536013 RepID=A0AAN9TED4_9HEMI